MATVTNSDRPKLEHPRLEGFVQHIVSMATLNAAVDGLAEAMSNAKPLDAAEALNRLRSSFSYDRWRVIENASYSLRDIADLEKKESAGEAEA